MMPLNKIKPKHTLDKFYTKDHIANYCISQLLRYVDSNDTFIEPSAGNGSFYHQLPFNRIGLDIQPEHDDIIEYDYFNYTIPNDCVIVGNPPFGSRNTLSKRFIKHSLSSKCIAFVLPMVYNKETLQKVFPDNWSLVYSERLPDNSFTLNGDDYHVPCLFQIWLKDDGYYDNLRESVKPIFETDDFTFVDKNIADSFMFGAAPHKIIDIGDVKCNNRGYWLIADDHVKERLKGIPWKDHALSTVNGGAAWFTKKQILNIYGEYYGNSQ